MLTMRYEKLGSAFAGFLASALLKVEACLTWPKTKIMIQINCYQFVTGILINIFRVYSGGFAETRSLGQMLPDHH